MPVAYPCMHCTPPAAIASMFGVGMWTSSPQPAPLG
jgi:hypothetical protein